MGEIAAKVVVQLLFATGKSFTVDGLREKLREFYREEVRPELRAAALNNVELITALISCNRQLGVVGLQLRILNGVVSLLTTEVQNKALGAYLNEQGTASGNLDLTTATLEVLACIAFKQPISQAQIDGGRRQPRLTRGIKAAWSNLLRRSSGGLLTVLAVNIEQAQRARTVRDGFRRCVWRLFLGTAQAGRHVPRLQVQAFDAQILVEPSRGYLADAGH